MDPAHPFPFISNLSLNLLVTLRYPDDAAAAARPRQGAGRRRHPALPAGRRRPSASCRSRRSWRTTSTCSSPAWRSTRCELFRVTRNANTERDEEEADDLLAMIESELRERQFAPIVRLQVGAGIDPRASRHARGRARPRRERRTCSRATGMLGHARPVGDRRRSTCRRCTTRRTIRSTTRQPRGHRATSSTSSATPARSCLHHPYESFATSVERFLARGGRGPEGAGDQDDALPHLGRHADHRAPDRGRAQRQAGRGGGRAQGALRRGGQHPAGRAAWRRSASTSPTASSA